MATTKIWAVKSNVGYVINYAGDEEKTTWSKSEIQTMQDVMDYAMNDGKTEQRHYVTTLNCTEDYAREEMQLVKTQFKKPIK